MSRYHVVCVCQDGRRGYVIESLSGRPVRFTKARADEHVAMLRENLGDEYQAIYIEKIPAAARATDQRGRFSR